MADSRSTACEAALRPTHRRSCRDTGGNTETPDWDTRVRELTDDRGVDCIVEIGGPGTIAMSLKALDVGGHVSLIGSSLSQSGDPLLLTGRGITLASISVGSRADFEAM